MTKCEKYIHFFGYNKSDENPNLMKPLKNSKTYHSSEKFEFYDYKGKASRDSQDVYMTFEELNEAML